MPSKYFQMPKCSVENCPSDTYHSNGIYCARHLGQFKRHGHILPRTRYDLNEVIFENGYVRMKLYNKYGVEIGETLIDIEDYEKCKKYKWHMVKNYVASRGDNKKTIFLSNLIMDFMPNRKEHVDHKNRNTLDNRKLNLRISTKSQNAINSKIKSSNTSGYKGVRWSKRLMKWEVVITVNGYAKYLGIYDYIHSAAQAYNEAAKKYFGEFASLNPISVEYERFSQDKTLEQLESIFIDFIVNISNEAFSTETISLLESMGNLILRNPNYHEMFTKSIEILANKIKELSK